MFGLKLENLKKKHLTWIQRYIDTLQLSILWVHVTYRLSNSDYIFTLCSKLESSKTSSGKNMFEPSVDYICILKGLGLKKAH